MSVVISTYNRTERLRACLEALARQTQPSTDFEVIVVVDGARDGTRDMLAGLTVPYALTVLAQENGGQQAARNRGVEAARGRYLLFLDDKIMAAPALVAEHLRAQRSDDRVVGIGQITMQAPPTADWFARCVAETWQEHYAELNRGRKRATWIDCGRSNVSLERGRFHAAGGFAEGPRHAQLLGLGHSLMQSGASFIYLPLAAGEVGDWNGIGELTAEYRASGAAYAHLVQRQPLLLPILVGRLVEANQRERILRAVIDLLWLPPRVLGWIGASLRDPVRASKWFRFLVSYFQWSGLRQAIYDRQMRRRLLHGTPILMYHAFTKEKNGDRFIVPAHRFARQMRWLRRLGFRVISLEEFLSYRRDHRLPPARSLVITIDDGYVDTLQHAFPVLHPHGYAATVFVVSGQVGSTNNWSNGDGLGGRALLSWDQIAQMASHGIEIGAHTESHPVLRGLAAERVRREVVGSKEEIERRLGVSVRAFAYPYGERDDAAQELVAQSGFCGACGVEPGLNTPGTPDYALHRVEIEGTTPLLRFLLAVWMGDTHLRLG